MNLPNEDNKVEVKYETQSEIFLKKIKETIETNIGADPRAMG